MFSSFAELSFEVNRLRAANADRTTIAALVERHLDTFPLHRGLMFLTVAELQAEGGDRDRALDTLALAVAGGARYRAAWLTGDARLAPLRSEARFASLVAKAQTAYDDAAAAAKPHLMFAMPDTLPDAFGYPLLMVLHGNNSNAAETAAKWAPMADRGWVVATPQSSEVGASPGAYTWNDRERTAKELELHFDRVKRATQIDSGRIVLAGFSMGGLQALALALTKRFTVRGVVAIAAWLPNIDEFASLIEGGAAKMLRAYVVVGERDPSRDGARRLVDVMTSHGVRARLDEREGVGHDYPDDMTETLATALAFATT